MLYHEVYLDEYYIDKYEVTVAQYRECVNAGVCTEPGTGGSCYFGVWSQHLTFGVLLRGLKGGAARG